MRFNTSDQSERARLNNAARSNDVALLKSILDSKLSTVTGDQQHPSPFPSQLEAADEKEYISLWIACTKGFDESIRFLLSHPAVDPCGNNNEIIKTIAANGPVTSLRLLLEDSRIDPSVDDNEPLIQACQVGESPECVALLLSHPSVNPNARNSLAFQYAQNNPKIMKAILDSKRTRQN
jgi:ankyrin repeat protein